MSKPAHINSPLQAQSRKNLAIRLGSDKGRSVALACGEYRPCVGCGDFFLPVGTQRYCNHACYSNSLRTPIEPRFWAKVNKTQTCWLWTASCTGQLNHGQFTLRRDGKQQHIYAHRFSWELANGPIPDGLWVLHHCDVPHCVNPDHLFLGDHTANMRDASVKGRLHVAHTSRQLTPQDRLDIFHAPRERGTGVVLARRYGVTKTCISLIRRGRFVGAPSLRQSQQLRESGSPSLEQSQGSVNGTDRPGEVVLVAGQFPNQFSHV